MFAEITALIGKAAAAKIQTAFGGKDVYIPVRIENALEDRNKRIRAAYSRKRNPASITELMREHDLSRRQIWNILKGPI